MENLLKRFNGDPHTKEAVLSFIADHLEKEIVKRARAGLDVKSLAEAINEVLRAFDELENQYGIQTPKPKETNQAR